MSCPRRHSIRCLSLAVRQVTARVECVRFVQMSYVQYVLCVCVCVVRPCSTTHTAKSRAHSFDIRTSRLTCAVASSSAPHSEWNTAWNKLITRNALAHDIVDKVFAVASSSSRHTSTTHQPELERTPTPNCSSTERVCKRALAACLQWASARRRGSNPTAAVCAFVRYKRRIVPRYNAVDIFCGNGAHFRVHTMA